MNKKINLSNRSIGLLQADNRKRFKGYVLGQRESEFQAYFAIWECFASCMEAKKKLWDYNTEVNFAEMEKKFKDNNAPEEELANAMIAVTEALNNVQTLELPDPLEAEKEIIVPLTEKYNLKVRFDAFYWDYILDHKTVATFTPEEKVEEKYGQQMRLYQYARYKYSGEKLPIYIQEVKKARASIPQEYSKKEDLLTLVPEEKREELKTVADIKNYLRTHPLKEWCGKRFEFAWTDEIIPEVEDLLRRAMIRADYLQTLSLEDVL